MGTITFSHNLGDSVSSLAQGTGYTGGTTNGILYNDGSDLFATSVNFTYDGKDVTLINSAPQKPLFMIKNTNTDDFASSIMFVKDSASPADGDSLGSLYFHGNDGAANDTQFARIEGVAGTVADASESGKLEFYITHNGTTEQSILSLGAEVVFNENSHDIDFRIEGNTDANLFFCDAGNDRVGIGTNTPDSTLNMVSSAAANKPDINIENSNADTSIPIVRLIKNSISPAANDGCGNISFYGYSTTGVRTGYVQTGAKTLVATQGDTCGQYTIDVVNHNTLIDQFHIDGDNGEIVFNETQADVNLRVEGDADANLLFTDAGNDRVGIKTNAPSVELEVNGDIDAERIRTSGSGSAPASGSGIEILYSTVTDKGAILSYDRTGGVYEKLEIEGNPLMLNKASGGKVGIGLEPTANMVGLSVEAGVITIKETTTPTADTNYGKIYTKTDNKIYFQDGAGVEHEIAFV